MDRPVYHTLCCDIGFFLPAITKCLIVVGCLVVEVFFVVESLSYKIRHHDMTVDRGGLL